MKRAIKEYPNEGNFYSNLVNFYNGIKKFKFAYNIAVKAYKKFSKHKYVKLAYFYALMNMGWQKFGSKKYKQSLKFFKKADMLNPDREQTFNAIGAIYRQLGKVKKSVKMLERGLKKYPDSKYIKNTLSWSYYAFAGNLMKKNKLKSSYKYYKQAFNLADKKLYNVYTSYLYALPRLKKFNEAIKIAGVLMQKFGHIKKIYDPVYWMYFNMALHYKKHKRYVKMMKAFRSAYDITKNYNETHKTESYTKTYRELIVTNIQNITNMIIRESFSFYKILKSHEKKLAYKYLRIFKKYLPGEMLYHYYNLYGSVLYREGKKRLAKKYLYRSYKMLRATDKKYRQVIRIPFFLKGLYITGGNDSDSAITHMGYNHNCYDIFGINKGLKMWKAETNPSNLKNWYGFGKIIYSPVNGKVIEVIDNGDEDTYPTKELSSIMNRVVILSNNKLFIFAHNKKNSAMVKKGDIVKTGQPLARLGNSSSFAPHVHFGVYTADYIISLPVQFTNISFYNNGRFRKVKYAMPGVYKNGKMTYYFTPKGIKLKRRNYSTIQLFGLGGFQAIYNKSVKK